MGTEWLVSLRSKTVLLNGVVTMLSWMTGSSFARMIPLMRGSRMNGAPPRYGRFVCGPPSHQCVCFGQMWATRSDGAR